MIYARVQDGRVVEIWPTLPVLHPDLMVTIHQAPEEVGQNWTFDGMAFSPPPPAINNPVLYELAGAARRQRQFRKALRADPLSALVQRANEDNR